MLDEDIDQANRSGGCWVFGKTLQQYLMRALLRRTEDGVGDLSRGERKRSLTYYLHFVLYTCFLLLPVLRCSAEFVLAAGVTPRSQVSAPRALRTV